MATGQILKDSQFYGGANATPMKPQQDLTQPLPAQTVSDQSFLGTPNKPKIATTATPVVSVNPKPVEASGFVPGQLGNIDTMSVPDIQDYVDYLTVRGQKQALTETEQRELLKAQRKLATQQATAVNPYTEQIQATEAERQRKEADLRRREQALVNAEEQRLKAYYDQQAAKIEQAGQKQQEAAQSVLSFGGFGRSTVAAEQQASIQQSINEAKAIQEAERNASLERYRAQQAGATAEELASYDQRISQLKQQNAQYVISTIEQANKINQQTAQSYQEKIDNILALSASFAPTEPLTAEEAAQAKSYAQLAIDQDGNINEAFVKMIPARLLGDVMKEAAIVKGARPGAGKEFGFINAGQGVIAVTDPTTGEITFAQGPQTQDFEFKTAGDQAFAFNPQTGQVEQITTTPGTLEGIGNGKVTAYGTGANPYGLDVDGKLGDPIVSKVGGQVVEVGSDPKGYGNYVIVQDAQGNKVRYAHTQNINVRKGDTINAGQQIATVGNSGYTIPGPNGDGSHVDITLFGPDGKEKGAKDVETYLKSAEPKVSPEAMAVINGTMKLSEVPAADRTRVAAEIQTSGQEIIKKSAATMAENAIKTANEIVTSPGFEGAVGLSLSKLGGYLDAPIKGTKAYDTYKLIEQLKGILTIPMLENMRGLGAMSEVEFKTMQGAATALDAGMTEAQFKKEIKKIIDTMNSVKQRAAQATTTTTQTTATSAPQGTSDPLGLR